MQFKPTKAKVIVTIIAVIIWWLYNNAILPMCECIPEAAESCTSWPSIMPFTECYCGCASFLDAVSNLLLFLAAPIGVYLIWSLVQKK